MHREKVLYMYFAAATCGLPVLVALVALLAKRSRKAGFSKEALGWLICYGLLIVIAQDDFPGGLDVLGAIAFVTYIYGWVMILKGKLRERIVLETFGGQIGLTSFTRVYLTTSAALAFLANWIPLIGATLLTAWTAAFLYLVFRNRKVSDLYSDD